MNIIKMSILPKVIYRFNAVPLKDSRDIFGRKRKKMMKFVWNLKKHHMAKIILRKKSKAGGMILSDFKFYYKTILIKTTY